jgi:CRP-like cAMP-binding protein
MEAMMSEKQPSGFKRQTYNTGNKIFNEGDIGDAVYLITSGEIELYYRKNNANVSIGKLGKGEIFGEMALINNSPRTATALVTNSCEVLAMTKEAFEASLTGINPVIRGILRTLTKRLIERQ